MVSGVPGSWERNSRRVLGSYERESGSGSQGSETLPKFLLLATPDRVPGLGKLVRLPFSENP
jgi:hypothetical protein